MKRLEFNEEHVRVIKEQLSGKIEVWSADERQRKYLTEVIHMAKDRLREYPDDFDYGDDLIAWIWKEYQDQEGLKG